MARQLEAISPAAPHGVVTFYNGACPVCRTEIDHYRRIDGRHELNLGWCDISREKETASTLGIDGELLKRRLHALDEQGRLHVGLDAFILLWSRLPRFRWLSRLAAFSPVHAVAGWFYEHILASTLYAMNRRRERRRRGG